MFYRDNWLEWTYENAEPYGPKLTPASRFKIDIKNVITRPIKSYYEELVANASLIRDTFTGDLDLLFSGGIDSEIILRVYHDLKIPINVYIFKYENNYNHKELVHAFKVCEELNVTPKVIDFNLEKFFEQDAYDIWTKCYSNSSGWLPHMKMTEYLDGTPIFGSGESYWRRTSRDMTTKHPWVFEFAEGPKHWAVYHKTIGRPAITDWYEYSPELIVAHTRLPMVQALLNDMIPGKLSINSSKAIIHQEWWPTIEVRSKMVGFEGDNDPGVMSKPKFMLDFGVKNIVAKVRSNTYVYSEEKLLTLLGAEPTTDQSEHSDPQVDSQLS